jgi:hypothetical protein
MPNARGRLCYCDDTPQVILVLYIPGIVPTEERVTDGATI